MAHDTARALRAEQLARTFGEGFDVGRAGGTPDDRLEAAFRLGYMAGLHDAEGDTVTALGDGRGRHLRAVR